MTAMASDDFDPRGSFPYAYGQLHEVIVHYLDNPYGKSDQARLAYLRKRVAEIEAVLTGIETVCPINPEPIIRSIP